MIDLINDPTVKLGACLILFLFSLAILSYSLLLIKNRANLDENE